MTNITLPVPEQLDVAPSQNGVSETASVALVQGQGRFSRLTYGTGEPKTTNVLGSSNASVDWNNQSDEK